MNVAELVELLKAHDPFMRVVVADTDGIFGAKPEDLRAVDLRDGNALLIAPREFVESWDDTGCRAATKPASAHTVATTDAALLATARERGPRCHEAVEVDIEDL